jgi:hypothetical protein
VRLYKKVLFVLKHDARKIYKEQEVKIHTALSLEPDGGEWSASCFGHFTSGERAPSTYCIVGWVGPIAGLDVM